MAKKKYKYRQGLHGLRLDPDEDAKLLALIEEKGISLKQLCRFLLRKWMQENLNNKQHDRINTGIF
jgi:hypothetical protein